MTIPQQRAWVGLAVSLSLFGIIFGFLAPEGADS